MTTPAKKYMKSMVLAFSAYAFILIGVNIALKQIEFPQWQQIILALLPMFPVFLVLRAALEFSRSWDELQRKKAMEATLISFLLVGFSTFAYGFLEGIGFPKLPIIWVMPMMMGVQGLAQAYVARKYE
ncbi:MULTISPECIES: hypothetical protein [Kordiimonas]|uniref:hypothetical protein n=1 Tax=Kordiimonas TaxID=288021 RepID=UPI001FF3B219|nr:MULTISPECIES: hypothetical protein [Kordiimonas]MCK0070122.1 hypothetical protein [Kordiimonas laminariae]UTW59122.1 hypothetical protein KFE96_02100 [Kordiimonas sp. SCSIO 12603]